MIDNHDEFKEVTLARACIVDGQPQPVGKTLELKATDANLLIGMGKAVPKGDDREANIIKAAKAAAARDAKK
jgi:hypothetical protein